MSHQPTPAVLAALGIGIAEYNWMVRTGKISRPKVYSAGTYFWSPEEVAALREALAKHRDGKARRRKAVASA